MLQGSQSLKKHVKSPMVKNSLWRGLSYTACNSNKALMFNRGKCKLSNRFLRIYLNGELSQQIRSRYSKVGQGRWSDGSYGVVLFPCGVFTVCKHVVRIYLGNTRVKVFRQIKTRYALNYRVLRSRQL